MAQTVFANSRGVDHKGSGGMSPVFPDVCKTQCGPPVIPIPYPNIGKAGDTTKGTKTVKVDKEMAMIKSAKYSKSTGDEAGALKGIISSTNRGECEYMMYSFDVKMEGKNVCRLGDPLFHNKKNIVG